MKFLVIILKILLVMNACSENKTEEFSESFDQKADQQEWILFKMTGNTPNSETTGSDMYWQEVYKINKDGSFIKIRNQEGTVTKAKGKYRLVEENNEKALSLTFNQPSPIIGNCTGDQTEYLYLNDKILRSTWMACDGPGLYYKRVD